MPGSCWIAPARSAHVATLDFCGADKASEYKTQPCSAMVTCARNGEGKKSKRESSTSRFSIRAGDGFGASLLDYM